MIIFFIISVFILFLFVLGSRLLGDYGFILVEDEGIIKDKYIREGKLRKRRFYEVEFSICFFTFVRVGKDDR